MWNDLQEKLRQGHTLSEEESLFCFTSLLSHQPSEIEMIAFLQSLHARTETIDEVTGAAKALLQEAILIKAPPGTIDVCGTGGDGQHTLNISTAVAFVVAACGVPVAKHGNRAASSRSGAADVLQALGLKMEIDAQEAEKNLAEDGIVFLFAPVFHPALARLADLRRKIGHATIFNLLGPLLCPADVQFQLVGVYEPHWVKPLAFALQRLGRDRAWVVHGQGLDELTTTGPSRIAALEDGQITVSEVSPEEAGLPRATLADLKGGDPTHNAASLRALLGGEKTPYRDIVLLNSAAALMIAGKDNSFVEGVNRAMDAIDSGTAQKKLERLIERAQNHA